MQKIKNKIKYIKQYLEGVEDLLYSVEKEKDILIEENNKLWDEIEKLREERE